MEAKILESISDTMHVESVDELWAVVDNVPRAQLTFEHGVVIASRRDDGTYVLDMMRTCAITTRDPKVAKSYVEAMIAAIEEADIFAPPPPSPPAF